MVGEFALSYLAGVSVELTILLVKFLIRLLREKSRPQYAGKHFERRD